MATTSRETSPQSGIESPVTAVLLCQELGDAVQIPSLGADVAVRVVGDVCRNPSAIRRVLGEMSVRRLVIGVCSGDLSKTEVQSHARRAGLDPLGIQVMDLSNYRDLADSSLYDERIQVVLAAAVARASAYPGSSTENAKATLASADQKISRRSLFTLPPITYVTAPTINREACAASDGCDLCVGGCPYGALSKDGDAIVVSRSQCRSCGLCVAVCPQRAVEFPGWSPQELEAQVYTLITANADLEPRAIAFVCEGSARPEDNGWLAVRVPCVAMIPVAAVLKSLTWGATSVAFSRCGDGCPPGAPDKVKGRVDFCRQLLLKLGGPSEVERVLFLDEQEEGLVQSVLDRPVQRDGASEKSRRFFGLRTAADGVTELARQYGVDDLVLDHTDAPLGTVRIDTQTCTGCGTCAVVCPVDALTYERVDEKIAVRFDASLCVGCGQCESTCPEKAAGAIAVTRGVDLKRLGQGRVTLFQDEEARCERCGKPVATARMLERIAGLLGDDYIPQHMGRLCNACRGH